MTQLSRDDVLGLARLSSIQLSDDEIESLGTDIDTILQYIEQLNELDTSGVEPTYQVNHPKNVWRNDEVRPSLSGEALVALAPQSQNNQIKVPKVL